MKTIWMIALAAVFVGCGVNDRPKVVDNNDGKSDTTPAAQQPPAQEGPVTPPPIAPPLEDLGTCDRAEQCIAAAPPHPRWCENGVLVQNGYDDIGCMAPPTCLRLDGATCGGPGTMDCHDGLECSTERDADNFGTCVRTEECIAASPPHPRWCENGVLVQNGYDNIGCKAPATCLRLDGATCGGPGTMDCHDGLECSTERDADNFGTCVRIEECIAASPPHPRWCENGVLVQNGYDNIGCKAPATCLRLDGATCDQLSMQCHDGLTCN